MMLLLPQILLSGMIFPLDAMAAGVRWIGYLLPLTYFTMVSQGVMLRGAGWDALWLPLTIIAVMAVVIFGYFTVMPLFTGWSIVSVEAAACELAGTV